MTEPWQIALEDKPAPSDVAFLKTALREFNRRQVGYRDDTEFAVWLRDETGQLRGGILCFTLWQWLTLDWVWVDEAARGQGFGRQLLLAAEAEGRRRGCLHAFVETLSFQAPQFYQKHGYQIIGELTDFPAGHSRFFLRKTL